MVRYMSEYTFPFHTCETPQQGIAQPYSALVNLVNCMVIFYFLVQTETIPAFIFLLFIFLFESFHMFSHIIHIQGAIQSNLIHLLAYGVNMSLLFLLYHSTNKLPNVLLYVLIIGADMYAFLNMNVVYYFFTQVLLFLSLIGSYYPWLSSSMKNNIKVLFFIALLILLLFFNEKYNCATMMSWHPFPYHVLIETLGVVFFYMICRAFYK